MKAFPSAGLDLLVQHRYLMAGSSPGATYLAPSLAHILSCSQPHPSLVTDKYLRRFKTSKNAEAGARKEAAASEKEDQQRARLGLIASFMILALAVFTYVGDKRAKSWLINSDRRFLNPGASTDADTSQA